MTMVVGDVLTDAYRRLAAWACAGEINRDQVDDLLITAMRALPSTCSECIQLKTRIAHALRPHGLTHEEVAGIANQLRQVMQTPACF